MAEVGEKVKPAPQPRVRWRLACGVALGLYAPMVLVHWWCVTGLGGWAIRGWFEVAGVPIFSAVVLLPFAGIAAAFGPGRQVAATCLGVLLLVVPMTMLCHAGRSLGFLWAGERAQPVADAIAACWAQSGRLPERVEDLVPVWLPAIPSRIPPLRLQARSAVYGNSKEVGVVPWSLSAMVPIGILNWDHFFYEPGEQYPVRAPGGSVQQLGRWAYYHE